MKIGILSDSHDNLTKLKKAVKLFNKNKAGYVLHLGDFVAPFSVAVLNNLKCPWQGVFGNNDGEKEGLLKISQSRISPAPLRIQLDNRKITMVHDINTIEIDKEPTDLILFGHTHRIQIEQNRTPLLLNPGECGGWLTGTSSVALLDLNNLAFKIFKL